MSNKDKWLTVSGCAVLIGATAIAVFLFLGWLAQTIYLAFAGETWPRPSFWIFVGVVFLISALVGAGRSSRRV